MMLMEFNKKSSLPILYIKAAALTPWLVLLYIEAAALAPWLGCPRQ
jgi:hypothetical protein